MGWGFLGANGSANQAAVGSSFLIRAAVVKNGDRDQIGNAVTKLPYSKVTA